MTDVRFDFGREEPLWGIFGENAGDASAVFPVFWNGEQVDVAVRLKNTHHKFALILFRRVESSEVYIVAESSDSSVDMAWFSLRYGHKTSSANEKAQQIISHALASGTTGYGRIHALSALTRNLPNPRWLFLREDQKCGCWQDGLFGSTSFRVRNENDLTAEAIEDPETPIAYALQWSQLAPEEQRKRAVIFKNGNWEEFNRLIRAIFYFESADDEDKLVVEYDCGFWMGTNNVPLSGWKLPGIRARRWASHLGRYFAPSRNQQLAQKHLCVADQSLHPLVTLNLPQPTQHERLEAALLLRDWAKGVIPPREARLLLPRL